MARFFPTTAAVALLGLLALASGAAASDDLIVQDGFLDAAETQQLTGQLPSPVGSSFRELMDVPAAIYGRLASVFANGADADAAAAGPNSSLTVPVRGERGSIRPHQDVHVGGALAETTVGLVYLAGDGHLTFTHKATGDETVVDVKPGRLLAWDNAAYTHALAGGAAARAMLGPMTFKAGSGFMALGDFDGVDGDGGPSYWDVNVQACLSSLVSTPGSTITVTVTIVVIGWVEGGDGDGDDDGRRKRELAAAGPLELSLTNDAAAGQLTLLRTAIKPNTWSPKLTASPSTASSVVYTIPADQVVTGKQYKLTYKFKIAKSVPVGTEIVFSFGSGGLGLTTEAYTTVVQHKTKNW